MNKANNTGEWVRWVKPSERLPETSGKYYCKTFAHLKEIIWLNTALPGWDTMFKREIAEWLDESLSIETGQQELIKYVNESFNETARIYGKVKRVAQYGGSIFIIFEDDSCYRLQWQSYRNDTVTLDASQPQEVNADGQKEPLYRWVMASEYNGEKWTIAKIIISGKEVPVMVTQNVIADVAGKTYSKEEILLLCKVETPEQDELWQDLVKYLNHYNSQNNSGQMYFPTLELKSKFTIIKK